MLGIIRHGVSHPPCRTYLLLPRVSWLCEVEAQGRRIARERQTGWKAEGQQKQTEIQNGKQSEGSVIYKRGKTYWYNFRWTIRNADGTNDSFRIVKSARTRNRNDANDVEDEHRRALRLGEIHPNDPWPKPTASAPPVFRAFAKEFLRYAETHTKPGTQTFYEGGLGRLLTFAAIADAPLNAITGELAGRYARHRQEVAENSIVTVNGDLRTLRRVLKLAVEWGRLDHTAAIHELPQPMGRSRVLSFTEEALYLAKASGNLRDATILAVDTGMRPNSELFPLPWADVDLTVRLESPHGVIHVRQGKTVSAQRSVPLTPRGAEVLQRRKREAEAVSRKSAFVFPGAGNSGRITSLQHPHAKAIEDAKLDSFEFYCWRHTFGTRAAQSGMDRFTLARLMGHSSPAVAARYYVHVTETHVAAGFGKFVEYQTRNVAEGIAAAFPEASDAIQ
jgi:integrase